MAQRADSGSGAASTPEPNVAPASSVEVAAAGYRRPLLTSLQKRLISAAVLLPAATLALWFGGQIWIAFVSIFGLTMIWEWHAICDSRRHAQIPWPHGRLVLPTIVAMATGGLAFCQMLLPMLQLPPAWFSLLVGVVLTVGSAWPGRGLASLWFGFGLVYVIPSCLAAMAIRAQPGDGLSTEFWIIALVVSADTGAYAAGRAIGGPKLAPRISPNKTWAGLAGAVLSAAAAGWATATMCALPSAWGLTLISGALAVVEQAGDLFESFLKRHFGVKDSGRIIPGHGGVLDRVDGLLAVILAVAAIEFLIGGGILGWL